MRGLAICCAIFGATAMILAAAILAVQLYAYDDPGPAPLYVVLDTDAGIDDLMALAMLLLAEGAKGPGFRPLRLKAVTVVDGIAHVAAGAANVARMLAQAGRADVPVYYGAAGAGSAHAFPAAWRADADAARGYTFAPSAAALPVPRPGAPAALAALLREPPGGPGSLAVLCLGPLTNLAAALALVPPDAAASALAGVLIMGGALGPPPPPAAPLPNNVSEWNFYVDSAAAAAVLAAPVAAPLALATANAAVWCGALTLDLRPGPAAPAPLRWLAEGLRALCGEQDGMLYDATAAGALLEAGPGPWSPSGGGLLAAWHPGPFQAVGDPASPRAGALEGGRPGRWAARAATRTHAGALARLLSSLAGAVGQAPQPP